MILFIIPSLLYVLWVKRETIESWFSVYRMRFSFFLVFLLGLFPYLYIPVAARQGSMVNWDRAVDLPSFIHLILRKDYGTFISNGIYGQLFYQRILQIKAYGEMILFDFTWIGIVLAVIGFIAIYTLHRRLFVLFFSALLFWVLCFSFMLVFRL